MKELIIFKNESFGEVRTQIIDSEPYFVAIDICSAIGLTDTNKALQKLDEDEKLTRKLFVSGQNRELWLVSESGLYSLILRSNKQEAKKFKKWITSEVLPSIRKTGKYELQQIAELDWQRTRIEGKVVRKDLTNAIDRLVEYAKDKGASDAVVFYYSTITAEVQKSVVYISKVAKQFKKNLRDCLSVRQLSFITTFEEGVMRVIDKGVEEDIGYKEIYQRIKETCNLLSEIVGKSKPAKLTNKEFAQSLTKKELKKIEESNNLQLHLTT